MTEPDTGTANTARGDDSVFGGRRWTLIVSILVLAVVVVGGTAAVLINRSGRDQAPSTPAPSAAAPSRTNQPDRADWGLPYLDELGFRVEVPPNPNGVALPQNDAERRAPDAADYTTAAPSGVMWQKVQNYTLPFSTSDGPTAVTGTLATGFAQTPQGAALAGLQLVNRSQSSFEGAAAVMQKRSIASTPDMQNQLDRNLENAQRQIAAGNTAAPSTPLFRQEAYRLRYFSPDYAVVEYAGKNASGSGWTTVPLELLWQGDDWFVKVTDQGKLGATPTLAGWTTWPGK